MFFLLLPINLQISLFLLAKGNLKSSFSQKVACINSNQLKKPENLKHFSETTNRSTANFFFFFYAAGQSTSLSIKNKDLSVTMLNTGEQFCLDILQATSVMKILNFIRISELLLALTTAAEVRLLPCLGHYNCPQILFI